MARPNGRDVARALEASRKGDHETLRLLSTGRKAASASLVLGVALRAAAESGHVDALKALLQFGAPAAGVPGADGNRSTPLVAACTGGHAECAAVLLAHGAPADVSLQPGGTTALHLACAGNHADCAALLIHHGASFDLANSSGETPLAVALKGTHAACATLLLDHGARVAADFIVGPGINGHSSCWGLVPRLLAAGADAGFRAPTASGVFTPLMGATWYGRSAAVRALCAVGGHQAADTQAPADAGWIDFHIVATRFFSLLESAASYPEQIENARACDDELIERCGEKMLITKAHTGALSSVVADAQHHTALEWGLLIQAQILAGGIGNFVDQRIRDGYLAPLLARWPLSAPLPDYDGVEALLPAAVGHAQRRLEVLRSGLDDGAGVQQQAALTAAFLQRVRDACGGAVAPAHATFARFRFVAGGGLERAWAEEREVHRFPVERVALARAALQVASDAEAAAAERCVPLLRELSALSAAGSGSSGSLDARKLRYAAAVAVGRWGVIRAAVSRAEEGVRSGEAALCAAVAEAEAQVGRLMQAKTWRRVRR